jgi:leader peptidase (prepilin peptidase) / N-methyltransferase
VEPRGRRIRRLFTPNPTVTLSDISAVPQAAWLGVAALLGLVFGSFVTALSYRLPRGQDFVAARSQCPACGTSLSARDLIPVISWAISGGKCRICASPVSARYPVTELIMAAVFVSAVWREPRLLELGLLLCAAILMMTLAIIDLESRRLPLPLLAILAVVLGVVRWLGPGDMQNALVAAAAIAASGLVIAATSRAWLGAPLMGAGDAYALSIAGLALPWAAFGFFLGLAAALGLVLGLGWRALRDEKLFPFAPAMFAALWLTLLFQDQMIGFVG